MLRIQRDESPASKTTFRLEGRLGSAELGLLLGDVEPCLASGCQVELDLIALRFLDDPGARLLSALSERGVKLTGATGYVHQLLCALETRTTKSASFPSLAPDPPRRLARSRPTPMSCESTLLERLRAGDESAYEEWVRAETPRLLGTLRRILRNEENARDAVQEAFLQAFRSLGDFAGQSRLSTWLHRIAINAALMQLRRRRRHPELSIDELLPHFSKDDRRVDPGPRWPAVHDDSVDRAELRRVLQACYDRLPEQQRLVLLLRDVEGLDTNEAAALLGVGRDAVKMRLHRARQALRTLLEPYLLEGVGPGEGVRRGRGAEPAYPSRGPRACRRRARIAATNAGGTGSGPAASESKARPWSSTLLRYPSR